MEENGRLKQKLPKSPKITQYEKLASLSINVNGYKPATPNNIKIDFSKFSLKKIEKS